MKQNAGPIAVVAAIVIVLGLMFTLYRTNFAGPAHNVSPENAPDYAKERGLVQTDGTATDPAAGNPAAVRTPYGGAPKAGGPGGGSGYPGASSYGRPPAPGGGAAPAPAPSAGN